MSILPNPTITVWKLSSNTTTTNVQYQTQTGSDFIEPDSSGINGRLYVVYNSTLNQNRIYWMASGSWNYSEGQTPFL